MAQREINLKKTTIPICDKCGCDLSDGNHDGMGGQNFWGVYLEFAKAKEGTSEIDTSQIYRNMVIIKSTILIERDKFVLCRECYDKIVKYILDDKI